MVNPKKVIAVSVALLLLSLGVAACGSDSSSSSSVTDGDGSATTGDSSSSQPVTIPFVTALKGSSFMNSAQCGGKAAAEEHNINFTFVGPTSGDYQQELDVFNAELVKDPDALVLLPLDPNAFLSPVRTTVENGTPVVLSNEGLAQENVASKLFNSDSIELGELGAEGLASEIGEEGEVAILAYNSSLAAIRQRIEGFEKGLENFPKIRVVDTQYSNGDAAKAASQVGAMVEAYPNLTAIFSTDEHNAQAAASALKANKVSGSVKLVSFDAGPPLVAALKAGTIQGLIAQNPYKTGFESVKFAAELARDEATVDPSEYLTVIGGQYITKDNVEDPAVEEYLYKESEC
jgi:ribose transport system substrate-binding protein